MSDRINNNNTSRNRDAFDYNCITLDSNMVGYLYVLSSKKCTPQEYFKIQKALSQEQWGIIMKIIDNNFKGINFHITPQVAFEVMQCAKLKKDPNMINFLSNILKVNIPSGRRDKIRYAELIADLVQYYTRKDIQLSNNVRENQSAVAEEIKDGVVSTADAKIVAENAFLNGYPIVTRNEKHLISISVFRRRNNIRSIAILDKNKEFFKNNRTKISSRIARRNLTNLKSTTFRINDLPYLLGK